MRTGLRLRRPADYARVKRLGTVYRHPGLLIGVCENQQSSNRYGIVTSRQLGKAVVRNKCKRRLRSILVNLHDGLNQGFDVVVVAKPAIVRQPFGELHRILNGLLLQAQLTGNC